MKVCVVGSGYVGLVSAAGFAKKGHNVVCVDIDPKKVDKINSKKPVIYEEGLQEILLEVVPKNLTASRDLRKAVLDSDVTFICVGTPSKENGEIDLSQVASVAESVGEIIKDKKDYHIVVVKSTVITGSTENTIIPVLEAKSGKNAGRDFGVCMNPEFLREGAAVKDFLKPDRIVVGALDKKSGDLVEELYKNFNSPILRTNIKTAEMIKYASNALLAAKISFINELGNVCKKMGIDVYDVAKGVGLDHRLGPHFLNAGPGFGGSCFPKDVSAMIKQAKKAGVEPLLLESVMEVNRRQPLALLKLVENKMSVRGKKIAVLGLAFKAGTDDVRESPALAVVNALLEKGAKVAAYDPQASENTRKILKEKIEYAKTAAEALEGAQAALIMTEWPEFARLDYSSMKNKIIFDSRKIIDKQKLPHGVEYEGLCW